MPFGSLPFLLLSIIGWTIIRPATVAGRPAHIEQGAVQTQQQAGNNLPTSISGWPKPPMRTRILFPACLQRLNGRSLPDRADDGGGSDPFHLEVHLARQRHESPGV